MVSEFRAPKEMLLGRNARREHKQSRARINILEAAEVVFQEKGLSGARLQDIAAQSGYTVPTLYTYFKNKEAIVEALFERLTHEIIETFSILPPKGYTLEQSLQFFIHQAFELSDRRRGLVLLVIEMHDRPEFLNSQRCTRVRELHEAIVHWLRQVLHGTSTQWSFEEMGVFLLGLWHSNTSLWLMEMDSGRLSDRAIAVCEMALKGILKGISPENL